MADTAIIDVADVWLSLGRGASAVSILKGVDLEVSEGQSLAITGPSGSGKSTLLMVLGGLERPDKGRVAVAGADIAAMGEDELTAFHLIPTMTAVENVAVPLELAGIADARGRALGELAAVGHGERANH